MPKRFLAILLLAQLPASGLAASLSVAPTRIDLEAGDPAAVVTLQNDAVEPVMVQVQTFAWPRSPGSADLEPTRDVLAVPPVFEVAGKGKQIIRVALRAPFAGERERAYRLLITEVPRGGTTGTGVRFALRLSLPVFVTPLGAEPRAVWSLRETRAAPELVLRNEGTAHLQVRRIVLRPSGNGVAAQSIETSAYVLAGQEHSWPLPSGTRSTTLQLEAETNIGPLPATVVPPRS